MTAIREADLGIERRYDLPGGSYHYRRPKDLEGQDVEDRGALTWVYGGQATFVDNEERVTRVREASLPGLRYADVSVDPAAYLRVGEAVRVDEYGQTWYLSGYDEAKMWDVLDAYDRRVEAELGPQPDAEPRSGVEWSDGSAPVDVDLDAWTYACPDPDGDAQIVNYSAADATPLTPVTSYHVRDKKVVFIFGATNADHVRYYGSGVMIDDSHVLTAAHVVAGQLGVTNPNTLHICTLGNLQAGAQCRTATAIHVPYLLGAGVPAYPAEDDYAVVPLSAPMSPSVGWMVLSDHSDWKLNHATHTHSGYPVVKPSCASNTTTTGLVNNGGDLIRTPSGFVYLPYRGATLYNADGPVYNNLAKVLQFNVAGGSGMSGGPYYFCPNGCTADSGAHVVSAVTHGHATVAPYWTNGVKARTIRDWVNLNY